MSLIKSGTFLTSPSQSLMHVLSIFFYQDELKRLKNIEQNTNHLKELGLWEYAPKKPNEKNSRKHTVSLDRKQQPYLKGNNGMGFFTLFHLHEFQFSDILTVN